MGRYYWSRKATADESCNLSIYELRRSRMLSGHTSGMTRWRSTHSGKETAIHLTVDVSGEPYAKFTYTVTDRKGSKTDYDYKVNLVTTPCHFGGVRYWFACPSCGRRAGALYLVPGDVYFRCRQCNNLSYQSRNLSGIGLFGETYRQVEKLRSEIKRWTWRGRPTRKVRRLRALERKMGVLSGPIMARLGKWEARLR
jgi:hypothetical protein